MSEQSAVESLLHDLIVEKLRQRELNEYWEPAEVLPDGQCLKMPEEPDPEAVRQSYFDVESIASQGRADGLSPLDATWHAASECLSNEKLDALKQLLQDDPDRLTSEMLALARLSELQSTLARVHFVATEELTKDVHKECKRAADVLDVNGITDLHEREYKLACMLGHLDALPATFTIGKLGSWEDDSVFAERCVMILNHLVCFFLRDSWRPLRTYQL